MFIVSYHNRKLLAFHAEYIVNLSSNEQMTIIIKYKQNHIVKKLPTLSWSYNRMSVSYIARILTENMFQFLRDENNSTFDMQDTHKGIKKTPDSFRIVFFIHSLSPSLSIDLHTWWFTLCSCKSSAKVIKFVQIMRIFILFVHTINKRKIWMKTPGVDVRSSNVHAWTILSSNFVIKMKF